MEPNSIALVGRFTHPLYAYYQRLQDLDKLKPDHARAHRGKATCPNCSTARTLALGTRILCDYRAMVSRECRQGISSIATSNRSYG
eukprot:39759-Eustigmatos_ZCMA.PRE.1